MDIFYCFWEETIQDTCFDREYYIQANYAKRIKRLVIYRSRVHKFVDGQGNEICLLGKNILIRTDYAHYEELEKLAMDQGAKLIETSYDRKLIQNWMKWYKTKRYMKMVFAADILAGTLSKDLKTFLNSCDFVFIKSKEKGFSSIVSTEELGNPDSSVAHMIQSMYESGFEELILSEKVNILGDSHGNLEARFYILGGLIINGSRYFHSLSHELPRGFIEKASEIVEELKSKVEFPKNYVLDIAQLYDERESYLDVIEINPISTAMCYVGNSIFAEEDEILLKTRNETGYGWEYCLDSLEYPDLYDSFARTEKLYTYHRDSEKENIGGKV